MKRRYVIVGGIVYFAFFATIWGALLMQGWRRAFWGEPINRAIVTACLEKEVVKDPSRYNGKMTICTSTKEIEVGTLVFETEVRETPTLVIMPGVKGENVFGALDKVLLGAPTQVDVISVDRVAVVDP